MRIRKLLAALLCSTALAMPAQSGPVIGFFQAFGAGLAGAGATTGAVASALGFGGAFQAGALLGGTVLGRLALSVGFSAISTALARQSIPSPSDRLVNFAQPISFMEWGVGRVRKGGPVCFTGFRQNVVVNPDGSDNRGKRHYGVLIAAHSTLGPVQHWLDKLQVETDEDGFVTTEPVKLGANWRAWHGSIRPYTGQPGQAADPIWLDVFDEVTSAFDFAGISYAAIYAARPKDKVLGQIYTTGREWAYSAVWDMADTIYDPRTENSGWTDNAALVIAWVALRYGKTVDWDEVAEQADISDDLVTNAEGATQRRWTINAVFDDSMPWNTVREQMQVACDGYFYERPDGKLGFKVGYYEEPTITLTDRDFLSVQITENDWGPDVAGSVVFEYVEPLADYLQAPSGAVVADPDGARREESCYLIDSHNQAFRVGWRWLKTLRARYSVSGVVKLIGLDLIDKRFVRVTLAEFGFDQVIEIGLLKRNGGGMWSFQISGVSVAAADFAPDALTLEPARPERAAVVSDNSVTSPLSLTLEVVEGTGGVAVIEATWPEQPDDVRQQIQLRSPDVGSGEWQIYDVESDQLSLQISGLVDGATYEGQIRNRTAANRLGPWMPFVPVSVVAVANTAAPSALVAFDAVEAGAGVLLTFTGENEARYAATRLYRATGSRDFADATQIRLEFGVPNLADSYTDAAPGAGDHTYWAEPVNGSGVAGPRAGPLGTARYVARFDLGEYRVGGSAALIGDVLALTRASAGSYVDAAGLIQSAAVDVPRLDHQLGAPALLIEPARTNEFLHSHDIGNAVWTRTSLNAITTAAMAAPNGGIAQNVTETTAALAHGFHQSKAITAGDPWTVSAKGRLGAGTRYLTLSLGRDSGGGADWVAARFDLATGTVVSTNLAGAGFVLAGDGAPAPRLLADGFWLCALTGIIGTATDLRARISLAASPTVYTAALGGREGYTGDGTSGVIFGGCGLEAGLFVTSEIVTGASAVTRAADVPTMQGVTDTLDVFATYGDGTTAALLAQAVSPGFWPALTETRIRQIVGRV